MRKTIPIVVAALAAGFVLAALILRQQLGGWLDLVLNWAIIIASAALLVAVAALILTHLRHIIRGQRGFIYSIILISAFLVSFVGALVLGLDNTAYLRWVVAIQLPLETSLLGLAALVMTGAALQIFRSRGWSLLTISFGISAGFGYLPWAAASVEHPSVNHHHRVSAAFASDWRARIADWHRHWRADDGSAGDAWPGKGLG